jgi:hypothetical protein
MSMGHRTQRVAPSSRGAVDPFFATRIVDGPRRLPETQNREGHPISATSGEPDKCRRKHPFGEGKTPNGNLRKDGVGVREI